MLPTESSQCKLLFPPPKRVGPTDQLTYIFRDNLADSFTLNVLAVHWVTRAFLPLLQKGTQKKVANM